MVEHPADLGLRVEYVAEHPRPGRARLQARRQPVKEFGTLNGKPITFDDYKPMVAPYTPEAVAKTSGLTVEQLKLLGGLFGDPKLKIVSLWCMGMNQHTMGTAINNLVHSVHLLSGHWGKPGDGPHSLTGQPSACGTVREVGTLCHLLPGGRKIDDPAHRADAEKLWNLPPARINPTVGHHTVLIWEKFCTPADKGGDIDTLWVQVTNPGQTLPNLSKLFRSKPADKFLIVSDVYPTATTELADLVLPSALWVEKNGIYGNSERRTQQWFKMVGPPGQARDDCWQTIAVAVAGDVRRPDPRSTLRRPRIGRGGVVDPGEGRPAKVRVGRTAHPGRRAGSAEGRRRPRRSGPIPLRRPRVDRYRPAGARRLPARPHGGAGHQR